MDAPPQSLRNLSVGTRYHKTHWTAENILGVAILDVLYEKTLVIYHLLKQVLEICLLWTFACVVQCVYVQMFLLYRSSDSLSKCCHKQYTSFFRWCILYCILQDVIILPIFTVILHFSSMSVRYSFLQRFWSFIHISRTCNYNNHVMVYCKGYENRMHAVISHKHTQMGRWNRTFGGGCTYSLRLPPSSQTVHGGESKDDGKNIRIYLAVRCTITMKSYCDLGCYWKLKIYGWGYNIYVPWREIPTGLYKGTWYWSQIIPSSLENFGGKFYKYTQTFFFFPLEKWICQCTCEFDILHQPSQSFYLHTDWFACTLRWKKIYI